MCSVAWTRWHPGTGGRPSSRPRRDGRRSDTGRRPLELEPHAPGASVLSRLPEAQRLARDRRRLTDRRVRRRFSLIRWLPWRGTRQRLSSRRGSRGGSARSTNSRSTGAIAARTERVVHGWREDGLLDRQVVSLQARRRDETPIATLVCFGCHTVSVGMDVPLYSADYPGALRRALRSSTGGEAVFFQGAGGNVNPLCAFCSDEAEASRMGERLALEAVHSLADRSAWPKRLVRQIDASLVPMINFRFEDAPDEPPSLAAVGGTGLLPAPACPVARRGSRDRGRVLRRSAVEAERGGAGAAERLGLLYHAKWARAVGRGSRGGARPECRAGPINAVRIGDGRHRDGSRRSLHRGRDGREGACHRDRRRCTAATRTERSATSPRPRHSTEGGYESAFSNRTYGLPAQVAPECERSARRARSVRLAEQPVPVSGSGLFRGRNGLRRCIELPDLPAGAACRVRPPEAATFRLQLHPPRVAPDARGPGVGRPLDRWYAIV